MKSKKELGMLVLAILVLIPALVVIDTVRSSPQNANGSKVVFFVS